ncbi:uncharacterized protein DFL_002524 [Arthrobotrys flagrans]|uniref:Uncharacterized protein n=1 Tax=Arthrobotrys flagrans TaxID=97331 RepID=A0A437AAQ2_ARTFL|nr:hypothetical protein DFL_002524 [Arthrobotrys flagrans]
MELEAQMVHCLCTDMPCIKVTGLGLVCNPIGPPLGHSNFPGSNNTQSGLANSNRYLIILTSLTALEGLLLWEATSGFISISNAL